MEEIGEDFVGGAGKARREPLEGGANGVADGDFFHGRSETGAGGWGDDGGMERRGFSTKGGTEETGCRLKMARKTVVVVRLKTAPSRTISLSTWPSLFRRGHGAQPTELTEQTRRFAP